MSEVKGTRTLSKKKYYELEEQLKNDFNEEQVETIMSKLRAVLHFDPNISVYTEKMKDSIYRRREMLKEAGVSTYVSSGTKAYYYKHRQNPETA
jgi:hypothetical protein